MRGRTGAVCKTEPSYSKSLSRAPQAMGQQDTLQVVPPCSSTVPLPGLRCSTPLSRHHHCSQCFSYMLNFSDSSLMSPCFCIPGCVVRYQQCWWQSCQSNAVLDLQLGCFAPQQGQLAPAELHAPEITHFPEIRAW